jgi:hypothetical protein
MSSDIEILQERFSKLHFVDETTELVESLIDIYYQVRDFNCSSELLLPLLEEIDYILSVCEDYESENNQFQLEAIINSKLQVMYKLDLEIQTLENQLNELTNNQNPPT